MQHNQKGLHVIYETWGTEIGGGNHKPRPHAQYEARMTIPPILPAGDYLVSVWIGHRLGTLLLRQVLGFRLWPHPEERAVTTRNRVVQPPVEWDVRERPTPA